MLKKNTLTAILILLIAAQANAQKTAGRLLLKIGEVEVKNNLIAEKINSEFEQSRFGGNYYSVFVFDKPLKPTQQKLLKSLGIELLYYLPDHSYQVKLKQIPSYTRLYETGVKAILHMPGNNKQGKELTQTLTTANSNNQLLINLQFYPGVKWEDVSSILTFYGATATKKDYLNQGLVQVSVSQNKVAAISELPFIAYLNLSFFKTEILNQRERGEFGLTNLTSFEVAGRNLTGNGIAVGIGDNADPDHLDNTINVINRNPSLSIYYNHGRHVTGIVGGDGILEEKYRGVAVKSLLVTDYFDYILTKSSVYYTDYNMIVTNNSYYNGLAGCPGDGDYNELSVYVDQQIYNNPFLQHVFAVGNDGNYTCSPYPYSFATVKSGYQSSKNALTVGNYSITADNLNQGTPGATSRGPVEDGRIKPEIIASGSSVPSTSINNSYTTGSGTSFSSPFVTGVWALLTERYKQLNGNAYPKSALLKAVICNAGDDKGNPGPDYSWGFGFVNPRKAIESLEQNRYFTGNLSTGGSASQVVAVPVGTRQVKVLLYWHDKEGSPSSINALVNDLDLTVTDGSTTYDPWVLNPDPSFVNSNATRAVDHLNNIEQVTIDNPGSSITVNINGFNIPTGSQEFFVAYEFLADEIKLEHPYGGERFSPGQEEIISWNATDNSSNTFKLEISLDDGSTWADINASITADQHHYRWTVPSTPTNKGKIRISRNGGGATATSPGNFTILQQPALSATVPCEGYVNLSWGAITSAADYEVMQLIDGELASIGTTSSLSYRVSGLDKNQSYWFTVRPRMTDSLGMRARAITITPNLATACSDAEFDNDLKIDALIAPANGRTNTSTQLSATQQITVRIKNLDDAATSGSYNISYQINGGAIITESSSVSITSAGTVNYTFATTADFSATGTYSVRVFVKQTGDIQIANDEQTYSVKHVDNSPVVLPFAETFESTGTTEYTANLFALTNADKFDFYTANSNGRLRTFINSGMSINGNRSVTLDAVHYNGTYSNNSLLGTINLSSYTATQGLRLDFKYRNHGQLKQPNTGFWMRGSDTDPWVLAYDLVANQGGLGEVKQPSFILNDLPQTLTSSFQVSFDESGAASANNASYDPLVQDQDDGFSFDDIRIVVANNDLMLTNLLAPGKYNCAAGNTPITIRVKNTTSSVYNNIPVSYRINNGVPVTENIPTLAGNTTIDYTFSTLADLSVYRAYDIDAWVSLASDDYPVNDSITNQMVYSSPVINSFPYLERFETGNGNWFTDTLQYSTWSWGTPAKIIMDRSANGSKGWFTTLNSIYNPNENSYLYSPCFNLSGLTQPVFSFSHISKQEDNCDCDYHTLDYSIDNGTTWTRVSTIGGGTNWFDGTNLAWKVSKTRWHVSSADVPNASNIKFRFNLSSDELTQYEGVGIDDIHIFDKQTIYTGANLLNINQSVSGNNWVDFKDAGSGNIVASINPMNQDLGSTNVSVYINTGAIRYNTSQYYLDRNLVIKPTNALTDSVLVRFYFTEQEATALIQATGCTGCTTIKDAYLAGVTKFSGTPANENGTLADNAGIHTFILPADVDVVPYNNGYYTEFKVRDFSEFWISGGGIGSDNALPLTLINFQGSKRYPHTDLIWKTENESNSDRFEIERKADNETEFIKIGSVKASGYTSQATSYAFTDNNVFSKSSQVYYRLKMIDKDGKFSYSQTIQLNHIKAEVFVKEVLNHSGNSLMILAGNKQNIAKMNVKILNSAGQVINNHLYPYQDTRINIQQLASGIYFLEITDESGKEVYRMKFIK